MSPAVTRRGLVRAAGAAIGATAAGVAVPALAGPAPDPDAALFDLIVRHAEAVADMHRLSAAADEARAAFLAAAPPLPDALRWREGDFPRQSIGRSLCDPDHDGERRWYGPRAAGWLRRHEPFPAWAVRVGALMSPEEAAASEARRLQIVGAWDTHQAERHAVEVGSGYEAACEALDDAAEFVCDLNAEIARVRPQTLPGLRALGAWFRQQVAADNIHDDFLELFAATVASFGEVAT